MKNEKKPCVSSFMYNEKKIMTNMEAIIFFLRRLYSYKA